MAWLCFPLWFVNTHTHTRAYTSEHTCHVLFSADVVEIVHDALWDPALVCRQIIVALNFYPATDVTSNSSLVNKKLWPDSSVCSLFGILRPRVGSTLSHWVDIQVAVLIQTIKCVSSYMQDKRCFLGRKQNGGMWSGAVTREVPFEGDAELVFIGFARERYCHSSGTTCFNFFANLTYRCKPTLIS